MSRSFSKVSGYTTPDVKNLAGETPVFSGMDPIEITAGGYIESRVVFGPCVDWIGFGIALAVRGGVGDGIVAVPDIADGVLLWCDNTGRVGLRAGADSPGPPSPGSRGADEATGLHLRLTWLSANTFRGESRQAGGEHDWQPVGDDVTHDLTPTWQSDAVILNWPWAAGRIVPSFDSSFRTGIA